MIMNEWLASLMWVNANFLFWMELISKNFTSHQQCCSPLTMTIARSFPLIEAQQPHQSRDEKQLWTFFVLHRLTPADETCQESTTNRRRRKEKQLEDPAAAARRTYQKTKNVFSSENVSTRKKTGFSGFPPKNKNHVWTRVCRFREVPYYWQVLWICIWLSTVVKLSTKSEKVDQSHRR